MRTVIVGASSGLGRTIGIGLGRRGHDVALLARRHDALLEAAKEAGNGAHAIRCDVTDESSCRDAIEQAASALGGIDSVVYASGVGPLSRLEDVDAETWRRVFDTNVMGASLSTAAALPHLTASNGAAIFLSSASTSLSAPWPGLGAYIVSKAALDKLVEAWRSEHPTVGFTRLVVGECGGGEGPSQSQFTTEWDGELATQFATAWIERRLITGSLLDVEELINIVETVIRCGASASIPSVSVIPRPVA